MKKMNVWHELETLIVSKKARILPSTTPNMQVRHFGQNTKNPPAIICALCTANPKSV